MSHFIIVAKCVTSVSNNQKTNKQQQKEKKGKKGKKMKLKRKWMERKIKEMKERKGKEKKERETGKSVFTALNSRREIFWVYRVTILRESDPR